MIAHVDMDAFYVAIELLRHPELRGKPVVVAYDGPRGVVTTASYEARKYGVHSALPMVTARRRCPELVVLPVDMALYKRGSLKVMETLREFSDVIEVLGMDEAYVDLSASPVPQSRAREIKRRITEATRLVLGHAFEELGLHRVSLEVFAFNPRAQRAYEKVGFVTEGVRRDALRFDGEWVDSVLMSVLDHEWSALASGT